MSKKEFRDKKSFSGDVRQKSCFVSGFCRKMSFAAYRCLRKSVSATAAVAVLLTSAFVTVPQFPSYAFDKAVETVYLGTPAHVWWETDTTGKWSSVSKAHEYQVKLYIADNVDRDEENWRKVDFDDEGMEEAECVMTKRTGETSCDFSAYMDDLHTYFFVVRATPKVSEQAYVKAGSWVGAPDADYRAAQINLRAGNVTKTAVEQAEMGVVSAQNSLNQLIYNYDMLVFTFENPSLLGNTAQAQ